MKSLHERRRNSVYMRVGAGTILAIIVWTVFGLVPGCSPDDPNCGISIPSPQFENDWMEEPMARVVYEEPTVFAKVQAVQQASLGDQRPTPTTFVSTVPTSIKVIEPERSPVVGETTFLSHAPGFSVIETGQYGFHSNVPECCLPLYHTTVSFLEERHLVSHHLQTLVLSLDVTPRQQRTRPRPKDLHG